MVHGIWSLRNIPTPPWIVPGILRQRTVTLVVAGTGVGKSAFSLYTSLCGATCSPFLEYAPAPRPKRVLYFALDAPDYDYASMARRIATGMEAEITSPGDEDDGWPQVFFDFEALNVLHPSMPHRVSAIDTIDLHAATDEEVVAKADIVVFDVLRRIHQVDENDNSQMAMVMDAVRKVADSGRAVMVLHHVNKAQGVLGTHSMRGATIIGDRADMVISLKMLGRGRNWKAIQGVWEKGRGFDLPGVIDYSMKWDRDRIEFVTNLRDETTEEGTDA